MPNLPLTLAVIYESLRLRDLVMTLSKLVAEDTVIPYTTWDDAGNIIHHTRPIKAGSHIIINSPACSRNPFAWKDVETYNPMRWIIKSDLGVNHFSGFSMGVRICIGKRMAEIEMITVIGIMCKEFKMSHVPQEGEGREEMVKRVLKGSEELNLRPPKFGLRLEKRE
jgi:cytochrome P450